MAEWEVERHRRRTENGQRVGTGNRERNRQPDPEKFWSMTRLAYRSGIATDTARRIYDTCQHLDWREVGRASYLPVDQIPGWDEAVEQYRATHPGRWQNRAPADPAAVPTPSFEDPVLTDLFTRYVNGETELREAVLRGMRDAFHRADDETPTEDP